MGSASGKVEADGGEVSVDVGVGLAGARLSVIVAVWEAVGVDQTWLRLGTVVAVIIPEGSGVVRPQAASRAALRTMRADSNTRLIILFPPACEANDNVVIIITRDCC